MQDNYSVELLRETGKRDFFNMENDVETRNNGLRMLLEAKKLGDHESAFIIAKLILDSYIKPTCRDPEEHALSILQYIANKGYLPARVLLNKYCKNRYNAAFSELLFDNGMPKPLTGFNGKKLKIKRRGILSPIDAVLSFEDGKNILSLSTNVVFIGDEDIPDPERFRNAVLKGLYMWEGEYEVLGGQKVHLKLDITEDARVFDNLIIAPLTADFAKNLRSVSNTFNTKAKANELNTLINSKRSFAVTGLKWSVNSRKIIWIQSLTGTFDEYDEITHIAKHEFGHALGIGDLYRSVEDSLNGVSKGTYTELDSYAVSDKNYNLVMCDHHGPISNNDIEMVILAFSENRMQLYQPSKLKGNISAALGRGN